MSGPTGRARVEAILQGRIIDHAPVMMWRHSPVDDGSGEELARSTVSFQEQFACDVVKVTPAQTAFPEMWGGASAYTGEALGTRTFLRRAIRSLEEWDGVRAAKVDLGPIEPQIDAARRTRAALGPQTVIVGTVFSPLSVFRYLCGDDLFGPSLRRDPRGALEALEVITAAVTRVCRELIAAGCDGLFVSLFPAGASYLSRDEYERFGVPGDHAVLEACRDTFFSLVHFHAPFPWLEFARDYACHAVSWDAWSTSPSLEEVRATVPGKVLVGGLDQRGLLCTGTATQARKAVHELVRRSSADLVLAPGCAIPQTVPMGNLRAVLGELAACGCDPAPDDAPAEGGARPREARQ